MTDTEINIAIAAAKERKPMENPEMEWINDLSSMSNETKTLLAQLSNQTITIQQYRLECAEKDMLRNNAEAQNQMLRDAISLCINTVECASTDSNGNELPWYKAAKAALSTNAGSELLAELQRLRDDLAKAQAQCAELKSEVETWNECYRFISDFYAQNPPDRWLNSRARKVATGKLT